MKKIVIITSVFAVFLMLSSCGSKTSEEVSKEETHEKVADEHANENTATLSEEQIKTIGIELGQIEQKNLTASIKANGVLTVPNQNKAFVVPLLSGVIRTLLVQPGSYVRQGQAIATIVNPDLIQMQQQLQQVNAQISLSEIELKRQKELVEGNAAPLKRLQQVQTELATLKTQRSGLQKQLSALGASQSFSSSVTVRAPISGTVSKVMAQLGSNVDVSAPIAEIVNNSQLHLDLYVYEKDLSKVKPNQIIHFTVTNNAGKEYDAEIFSIGTAFESNTKTIPVHAKVMGDKTGLIDGMNVTANISLDKTTVPAVPTEAIISFQGQDYIFIVDSVETKKSITHFRRIPVVKGTSDVGYSEITLLKEVPAGARVVTKGSFFILAKQTNTEGHSD
ncbi:MAG: efflux RND transporter periplasmic adaptor subunit [Ferruginibacter sp.]